jgi:hypothetical protein
MRNVILTVFIVAVVLQGAMCADTKLTPYDPNKNESFCEWSGWLGHIQWKYGPNKATTENYDVLIREGEDALAKLKAERPAKNKPVSAVDPNSIRKLAESGRICEVMGHSYGWKFDGIRGYPKCRLCGCAETINVDVMEKKGSE